MPDESDDFFADDPDLEAEQFEALMDRLFQLIAEFAEDEELANELVAPMLLRTALTMRMMNYVVTTAKPSGGGLKLDLDRFRRDIDELVRDVKKDADRTVATMKETIAAAALELDEPEDEA